MSVVLRAREEYTVMAEGKKMTCRSTDCSSRVVVKWEEEFQYQNRFLQLFSIASQNNSRKNYCVILLSLLFQQGKDRFKWDPDPGNQSQIGIEDMIPHAVLSPFVDNTPCTTDWGVAGPTKIVDSRKKEILMDGWLVLRNSEWNLEAILTHPWLHCLPITTVY